MISHFPLTSLQEGMYLESIGSGRPWVYLEQIVCHVDDAVLDADAMARAWGHLIQRHPALRCVIEGDADESPTQRITQGGPVDVTRIDWTGKSDADLETDFANFLREDRNKGVDAGKFPGFRVQIFHCTGERSKLVWTFPHTLLDGRSFGDLLEEVFDLYEATRQGKPIAPPAPQDTPIFQQHCDTLDALPHDAGAAHFGEVLRGWEGGDGLLVDGATSSRKTYVDLTLTKDETTRLSALARACDVTFSTVVMAAWGIVTARFAGRDDTVFGATLNGRHLVPGAADVVGCFIVTVPMRLRLAPDLTVGGILEKMRADQIALRPHEQTPLTRIKAETDVPPGVPLFDTLVMFETATLDQQMVNRGGVWANRRVDLLEEGDEPVTFAAYQGDALKITVEYDPGMVPQGDRLAQYIVQFLRNLASATPDTMLAGVSMLDVDETATLRDLSGHDSIRYADAPSCAALFDGVVEKFADRTALIQRGETSLSYADMDRAANRLAHLLLANGVTPGDVVGICTERSPNFMISVIATWKAGAAWVPMDPSYPVETLNIIAEDSGARLVLVGRTAPRFDIPALNLAKELEGDLPDHAPDIPAPIGDDAAYMIFTSGTTGRPKGVVVSHRSLAAHSVAAASLFELTELDRVLQFASLSFDVAVEEVVATLLAGATLVLRTDSMARSTATFLEQCEANQLTLLNLPTGFWAALTDALDDSDQTLPPTVRMVVVGGERVSRSVLRRWRARLPDVAWVNGYGTTETTITCTAHRLHDRDLERPDVPIGSPLSHAGNWVLAADGALAPLGTPGQLWISGPAVATGYVGLPDLTAERFRAAPFDASLGRMNGTGDRVFWRDGLMHFIGRVDRQIKLRGFRIEPGQIEQVLESQHDVGRSHVALLSDAGMAPRLVGWFSAAEHEAPPDTQALSARLSKVLPVHMRPELVLVDQWPETPGGKIDEKKLPKPASRNKSDGPAVEETPLTREIGKMFGDVLKTDPVPGDGSFFEYGGNSLLLLRLLAKVEKAHGVRVNPTALYADPTPRGVVQALQDQDTDPLVVLPIQPEGTQPPLFGVHVLGDNGSFFRPLAAELGPDQPFFGLTVGLLTEDTPTTVPDIAQFYLNQIERQTPEGPLSLIAVSAGSYVTLELAQQLQASGREVQALILLDAQGPDGRARVGQLGRVAAHIRLFGRSPVAYLRKLLAEKIETLQHSRARAQLEQKQNDAKADEGDAIQSIAAFIAANTMAIEGYSPQPYDRRLTIIRAGDNLFDSAEARATGLGWSSVAKAGFDLWDVPGDHLGILEPPNTAPLAACVKRAMKNAKNR